jgi:hypothetical protein
VKGHGETPLNNEYDSEGQECKPGSVGRRKMNGEVEGG